jgi:glycosyltransferase involved in cell wall biosynthesis
MLSVVCPIYNEENRIEDCILSVIAQDYPKEDLEVLFVDGRSDDRTRDIIGEYSQRYPFIQLLDNPQRIVPTGLNIGIRAAQGDVILRLDAHAKYPTDYFSVLVNKLRNSSADNVGGVCNTLPAQDTPECRAIAHAMSSPFGMGNSHFRIGTDHEMWVDTVPFGCFRREIFDKVGLFDEELVRNQDDEFNGRIIQNGGRILLLPQVVTDYFARDSVRKTAKMFYQYGLFKPLVNKKLQKPTTLRQFFPPLFFAGIIVGGLLSLFFPLIRWLYFGVLILYVLAGLFFGFNIQNRWPDILWMPIIFATIHLSYGCGYWIGAFKLLFHKEITAQSNH